MKAHLILALVAIAVLGLRSGAAAEEAPSSPTPSPKTLELIEDLRILAILTPLRLKPEQATKLAGVATAAKEGLAAIDADAKARLDQQRGRLLAAREIAFRGGVIPPFTESQLTLATQSAEGARAQKTATLIDDLSRRVRGILSREQAEHIETDLAPTFNQPWRRYARILSGPGATPKAGGKMPSDPGKWLNELRDLRLDSAEGDPMKEIKDFGKKLTRGLPGDSPLLDASVNQAQGFARQVLAMSPAEFNQRETELARIVAKQELSTRNQQRALEGKPLETFDPYRWLVEEVLLSPRAPADLRDMANAG
jgi:hypothetical protein